MPPGIDKYDADANNDDKGAIVVIPSVNSMNEVGSMATQPSSTRTREKLRDKQVIYHLCNIRIVPLISVPRSVVISLR